MAERWRVGPVGTTLYRDGELVGGVETPELAAEIVETMNRVGALLDEVRRQPEGDCDDGCTAHATCRPETGRERSHAAGECAAETWSWSHFRDTQLDGYWIRCTLSVPHDEHEDEHTGLRWRSGEPPDGEQPADAQRRSEATPQNAFDLARLDPYDHSKGFTPKNGEHPE